MILFKDNQNYSPYMWEVSGSYFNIHVLLYSCLTDVSFTVFISKCSNGWGIYFFIFCTFLSTLFSGYTYRLFFNVSLRTKYILPFP